MPSGVGVQTNQDVGSSDAADRSNLLKLRDDGKAGAAAAEPMFAIASVLAGAYWQCGVSGLRLGLATTRILAQGQLKLLEYARSSALPEFREQALRVVVDDARLCLRDVADAAFEELGRLRSELTALQDAAREVVPGREDAETAYQRRWKVKP
jgi:hypothetical protein